MGWLAAEVNPRDIPLLYSDDRDTGAAGDFPPRWARGTVFYQIFLERFANGNRRNDPPGCQCWGDRPDRECFFGGDLEGLIGKLDYLSELGVGGIYLNPIFLSPSNHKYDTQDYLLIDPHFGSLRVLGELLDAAHARGMKILLDGVFNHTGDHFWAFQHVLRNGQGSPYRDWFYCRDFPLRQHPEPNYESWWGFASLPKLNVANPEVLTYLTRVITFWTSFGIDGWRLDVPNEVPGFFWRYFRRLVREINPEAYLVGEIWDDGRPWLGGDMFDAVMNYPWRELVVKFLAAREIGLGEFLAGLDTVYARHPESIASGMFNLLGSHDTARFLTLAGNDPRRLKLAAMLQFAYPGAPVIFYGDEVGLAGGADPDCRRTMPWDPAAQNLDLLAYFRRIGQIRKSSPALRLGRQTRIHQDNEAWTWAIAREAEGERVLAAFNASESEQTIVLEPPGEKAAVWEDLLRGKSQAAEGDGSIRINLPPLSAGLLRACRDRRSSPEV